MMELRWTHFAIRVKGSAPWEYVWEIVCTLKNPTDERRSKKANELIARYGESVCIWSTNDGTKKAEARLNKREEKDDDEVAA